MPAAKIKTRRPSQQSRQPQGQAQAQAVGKSLTFFKDIRLPRMVWMSFFLEMLVYLVAQAPDRTSMTLDSGLN